MVNEMKIKDLIAFAVFIIITLVLSNIHYKLIPLALVGFMSYLELKDWKKTKNKISFLWFIIISNVIFIIIIFLNYFFW